LSNLPIASHAPRLPSASRDRRTAQAIARIHTDAVVAQAADDARAYLARRRLQDIQALTQQSLAAATEIDAVEQICADRAPHAVARLHLIAQVGTAGIAQTLNDFIQS
jgi:hypothetical protein